MHGDEFYARWYKMIARRGRPPAYDREAALMAIAEAFRDCVDQEAAAWQEGMRARADNVASRLENVRYLADDILNEFVPGLTLPHADSPVETKRVANLFLDAGFCPSHWFQ